LRVAVKVSESPEAKLKVEGSIVIAVSVKGGGGGGGGGGEVVNTLSEVISVLL
jgi:hypothetical protein